MDIIRFLIKQFLIKLVIRCISCPRLRISYYKYQFHFIIIYLYY